MIPDVPRGLSGAAEEEAFRTLPAPPAELGERIAHRILMLVLPALAEGDLAAFGRGITEVQALVGEMFRPVQGERFAHARVAELVSALLAAGAAGAGQSSWGPAVFGFFASEDEARRAEASRGRKRRRVRHAVRQHRREELDGLGYENCQRSFSLLKYM